MRNMQHVGGPLRRMLPRAQLLTAGRTTIFKRFAFAGRPEKVEQKLNQARALPTTPARTRFAPSPTGYLHLGSLRTALFNYLLAKATGGQFLLRLEDTDQTRIVSDAEQRLYEDMKWAGLQWDEGPDIGGEFGPYKQSDRLPIYRQHVKELLDQDKAYRCFCSPERLDEIKKLAMANGEEMTGYDGHCSHIPVPESERRAASGEAHCVRFKTHGSGSNFKPLFSDLVYGAYKPPPGSVDDFIIMKRDGFPTYHFANVVDDHLMEITHVIRGAEWLVSTPRHVGLYDAFGWKSPTFAHVGLLTDQNKQKLSKRHGDIDIASYRNKGYLPEGLLNYVVLLGWSPGKGTKGTSEVMDLQQMVEKFHLRFTRGDIRVSNKLDFLNNKHKSKFLAQSPEDLQVQVVPPLALAIRNLEKERAKLFTGPPPPPQLSEDIDNNNNVAATLDQFVPAMTTTGDDAAGLDYNAAYIGKVFELDQKTYVNAASYVKRNRYLIWTVPTELYRQTLLEGLRDVRCLFVRSPADAAAESGTVEQQHTDSEMDAAGIAGLFADALRDIPADESSWTKERLEEVLNPLIKSIYGMRTSPETEEPWGFHMLRWFLCALQPGPALIPSMVVLGKTETMNRIQRAIDSIA
ncbi:glutamyl-tRNA synthetase [Apiospora hydei]|uniref:glutamate--tRNA ligase n=1 Tax=Apiospora hydei TaxID=1337664 RepID=A0ABR1V5E7_9PEZI